MDLTPLCQLYDIDIALLPKDIQNELYNTKFDYLEAILLSAPDLPEKEFTHIQALLQDVRQFQKKPMMKFFEGVCKQNFVMRKETKSAIINNPYIVQISSLL